jgi:hypothetical protein
MLSEMSQTQKKNYCMISLKCDTIFFKKKGKYTEVGNKTDVTWGRRGDGERNEEM